MNKSLGASADAETGSHAAHEARSDLRPSGFDPARRLEFRPDEDGKFDEIVARFADGMVHAEMMDDNACYVGFYWDDGRYCQWWFGARGKLWNNHEDGEGPPGRFTAWGVDTRPDEPLSPAVAKAIAMEARQGGDHEDERHAKHDSAGPQDIAQTTPPSSNEGKLS